MPWQDQHWESQWTPHKLHTKNSTMEAGERRGAGVSCRRKHPKDVQHHQWSGKCKSKLEWVTILYLFNNNKKDWQYKSGLTNFYIAGGFSNQHSDFAKELGISQSWIFTWFYPAIPLLDRKLVRETETSISTGAEGAPPSVNRKIIEATQMPISDRMDDRVSSGISYNKDKWNTAIKNNMDNQQYLREKNPQRWHVC